MIAVDLMHTRTECEMLRKGYNVGRPMGTLGKVRMMRAYFAEMRTAFGMGGNAENVFTGPETKLRLHR